MCVAAFKGKSDSGPTKKKKSKKQNFKERGPDVKIPTPKSQQQQPLSAKQKAQKGPEKLSGPKTKSINGSTAQVPQGKICVYLSRRDLPKSVLSLCWLTFILLIPQSHSIFLFIFKEEM